MALALMLAVPALGADGPGERHHDRHPAPAGSGVRRRQRSVASAQHATRRPPTGCRRSSTTCATKSIYLKVKLRKEGVSQPRRLQRRAERTWTPCARKRAASPWRHGQRAGRPRHVPARRARQRHGQRQRQRFRHRHVGSGGIYGGTTDAQNPNGQRAGPAQRSARRPGDRRAPRARVELRYGAGRGSLHGDDRRRSLPGQRRADSRRLDAARRRQLGEQGDAAPTARAA